MWRRMLVHVIDGTSRDPVGDYQAIQQELALFSPALAGKPQLVAYNKMDVPDSSDYWDIVQDFLLSEVCAKRRRHQLIDMLPQLLLPECCVCLYVADVTLCASLHTRSECTTVARCDTPFKTP